MSFKKTLLLEFTDFQDCPGPLTIFKDLCWTKIQVLSRISKTHMNPFTNQGIESHSVCVCGGGGGGGVQRILLTVIFGPYLIAIQLGEGAYHSDKFSPHCPILS